MGRERGAPALMRFDLLTLFPDFFRSPLAYGVVSRALSAGLAEVHSHDLRTWTHDRHRTVDDRPFGGGEGMVLKVEPIAGALASMGMASLGTASLGVAFRGTISAGPTSRGGRDPERERVILLSAQGKRFTQATARKLASLERIVLICGRYEGVDERVSELFCDDELSIGDYVLSGGELGAAVIVDAVVRLLPGVLGHADSSRFESFGLQDPDGPVVAEFPDGPAVAKHPDRPAVAQHPDGPAVAPYPEDVAVIPGGPPRSTHAAGGLLDYPHYTRPASFLGSTVPAVLSGGDHRAIRRWRREAALAKTLRNRPDLLAAAALTDSALSDEDRAFLASLGHPAE